jgi:hypothetical protein
LVDGNAVAEQIATSARKSLTFEQEQSKAVCEWNKLDAYHVGYSPVKASDHKVWLPPSFWIGDFETI